MSYSNRPYFDVSKLLFVITLLVVFLVNPVLAQVEEARLFVENAFDFGKSVSLEGNRALIGASNSVYVFERQTDGSWQEQALLMASDGALNEGFGRAVSLLGDRALVGEIGVDQAAGAVYVFERNTNGVWIETAKLVASDREADDWFGASVSLSERRAFVGAVRDDDNGSHSGSVYLYDLLSDGSWHEVAKLAASDGLPNEEFGGSVIIEGDRALVTSPYSEVSEFHFGQGAGYIFERQTDGAWLEVAKLVASDGEQHTYLGRSASLEGDRAVLGAIGAEAAYIFERQANGSWIEISKLTASDGEVYDHFGAAVSLEGNRLLVGADDNDNYNGVIAGSVYVFERQSDGSWVEVNKLVASDGNVSDAYGITLSLSGDFAIIGDDNHQNDVEGRGAVYVIDFGEPLKAVTSFTLINPGTDLPVQEFDPIRQGVILGLHELPLAQNVRANVIGDDVESVRFDYVDDKGQSYSRIESEPPYALFGGVMDNYAEGRLFLGAQTITATPFSLDGAQGKAGTAASVTFKTEFIEAPQAVTGFTLIDAQSNLPIQGFDAIKQDIILSLNLLSGPLNIRANTIGEKIKSVRFDYTIEQEGAQPPVTNHSRKEYTPPYALFGDVSGDYIDGPFQPGIYTITATPFSMAGAQGEAFTPAKITFEVVRGDPELLVTGFTLVNATTDEDLGSLGDYGFIVTGRIDNPSGLPLTFNIRANVEGPVESVAFEFEPAGYELIEHEAPYALFGDVSGDYTPGVLERQTLLTLTATPYREPGARGLAGDPARIHFTLQSSPPSGVDTGASLNDLTLSSSVLPDAFDLDVAYPNPFRNSTTIQFAVPEAQHVKLAVYDMLGREVQTLVDGVKDAGMHVEFFEAGDLPSGTYLYRLESSERSLIQKILLLR